MKLLLALLIAFVSNSAYAEADYDFTDGVLYYKIVSLEDLTCKLVAGDEKYTGDIVIPSTVAYNGRTLTVTSIDGGSYPTGGTFREGAFGNCESLISVVIPNSVTAIANYTFWGCKNLMSIELPNSIWRIGIDAFNHCESLTTVVIPNSVTRISDCAFNGCISLASVDIPNSVTYIGEGAFCNCGLTSVVIPNSITSIEASTFDICQSLVSVVIPNSVTFINENAFTCSILNQLEVGNSYVLETMLKYWNLPKTLIVAEDYSDTSFPSLTYSDYSGGENLSLDTIVCKTATPPTLPATFSDSQYENLVVIVPSEELATYQATDVWKNFRSLQGGAENYSTTGIATVTTDHNDKAAAIFDLNGRKLKTPQKGLNIINGKKIVVR